MIIFSVTNMTIVFLRAIIFRWLPRFYSWLVLWLVGELPPGKTNILFTKIMITNHTMAQLTNTNILITNINPIMIQVTKPPSPS